MKTKTNATLTCSEHRLYSPSDHGRHSTFTLRLFSDNQWELTFMNPSLFSLCSLEAALWRRFLWEFKRESSTCHQVRQFSTKASPTIDAIEMRIALTVRCFGSTRNIARRVIPAIMQPKIKRKMTKDGRQHVFFHFFLPVHTANGFNNYFHIKDLENPNEYTDSIWQIWHSVHVFIPAWIPIHTQRRRWKSYPVYLQSWILEKAWLPKSQTLSHKHPTGSRSFPPSMFLHQRWTADCNL